MQLVLQLEWTNNINKQKQLLYINDTNRLDISTKGYCSKRRSPFPAKYLCSNHRTTFARTIEEPLLETLNPFVFCHCCFKGFFYKGQLNMLSLYALTKRTFSNLRIKIFNLVTAMLFSRLFLYRAVCYGLDKRILQVTYKN